MSLRFAYNTNGFSHHDFGAIPSLLTDLGYEGIAITLDVHHAHPFKMSPLEVASVKQRMEDHGLHSVIETGARFLLIGAIYERRHTRRIIDFGGLAPVVPKLAIIFFITTLSSIGLPFLNGFIGEFLILQGAYSRNVYYAAFAGLGIILGAVYMLTLYRRIFFGETDREENAEMKDLNGRELAFLMPLVGLMVLLGLFSPWFTSKIEPSILRWLELVKAGGG